jgi:hypothetical protein
MKSVRMKSVRMKSGRMKAVTAGVAAAVVLTGCAARVGDTALNLHQRAVFQDGTSVALSEFKLSERDSGRARGSLKTPGPEVTVWVEVRNSGQPMKAREVRMDLFYTDRDGVEVKPPQIATSENVVATGRRDRLSKTYRVDRVPEVFQTRHIRVVFSAPGYPRIMFSGSNP